MNFWEKKKSICSNTSQITHHHVSRSRVRMSFFGNIQLQSCNKVPLYLIWTNSNCCEIDALNKLEYLHTIEHYFGFHRRITRFIFAMIIHDVIHFLKQVSRWPSRSSGLLCLLDVTAMLTKVVVVNKSTTNKQV